MLYYGSLMKQAQAYAIANSVDMEKRKPINEVIAPVYTSLHDDVLDGKHSLYYLPGGRGSGKSSFVSLELVDGLMRDPEANAVVIRKTAATLRESVFSQVAWAIDTLGVTDLWHSSVAPMAFTFKPTGAQIIFRGLDDPSKLKSLKPRHGIFRYSWVEEFSELAGANEFRSLLQSIRRGGDGFRTFCSFNPPRSRNHWANTYVTQPDDRAMVFKTDYMMVPAQWLGEDFLAEAARLQEVNELAYRHEYLAEPVGFGGEVYPTIQEQTLTDEEISEMGQFYMGIDFGFAQDPCAVVRVSYDPKHETVYIVDEVYGLHMTNGDIAEAIKARGYDTTGSVYHSLLTGYSSHLEKQVIYADSAEPKSIADLNNLGLKVYPCTKFAGCVQYRVRWLQSRKIIIDPKRTPHAFQELTSYQYECTKDGEVTSTLPDKNNHIGDALAYSLDRVIYDRRNHA